MSEHYDFHLEKMVDGFKEKRKYKKYLKSLKKDIVKGFGISKKELFGKNAPVAGIEIALKYLKEREAIWIKSARKFFENEFLEIIKKEMPEVDINEIEIKWSDLNER